MYIAAFKATFVYNDKSVYDDKSGVFGTIRCCSGCASRHSRRYLSPNVVSSIQKRSPQHSHICRFRGAIVAVHARGTWKGSSYSNVGARGALQQYDSHGCGAKAWCRCTVGMATARKHGVHANAAVTSALPCSVVWHTTPRGLARLR